MNEKTSGAELKTEGKPNLMKKGSQERRWTSEKNDLPVFTNNNYQGVGSAPNYYRFRPEPAAPHQAFHPSSKPLINSNPISQHPRPRFFPVPMPRYDVPLDQHQMPLQQSADSSHFDAARFSMFNQKRAGYIEERFLPQLPYPFPYSSPYNGQPAKKQRTMHLFPDPTHASLYQSQVSNQPQHFIGNIAQNQKNSLKVNNIITDQDHRNSIPSGMRQVDALTGQETSVAERVASMQNLKRLVSDKVEAHGGREFSTLFSTAVKTSEKVVENQIHKKFVIGANRHYMGSSKYKGVCFNRKKQKWRARLSNRGTREFLGDWDTELEAALVYDERLKELFKGAENLKERLNFPQGL